MGQKTPDFAGWATKYGIRCSDGRTISNGAFDHSDTQKVPLVWNHDHNDPFNVLGHAYLYKKNGGIWAEGFFNDTEQGKNAMTLLQHGDITSLSIYAGGLKEKCYQNGEKTVVHGDIKELSLVTAGANPTATIESVNMYHSEDGSELEDAIIAVGEYDNEIVTEFSHSDDSKGDETMTEDQQTLAHADDQKESGSDTTVEKIIKSMTEEQKQAMYVLLAAALEKQADELGNGDGEMKQNFFAQESEGTMTSNGVLSHEAQGVILGDAPKYGKLSEAVLAHAEEYGIDGIEWLFPEVHAMNTQPEFITRNEEWVTKVMNGAKKLPWSKVKSLFADITEDDARARGYIKGKYKKDEVFTLLKRSTQPTTVYKKQKLDRDDIIDITDFSVVALIKGEMRGRLDAEIARAALIGDGRLSSSDDKIKEDCIRPIWKDDDFFTIKSVVKYASGDTEAVKADKKIEAIIRARKNYRGSGNPTLFTTEEFVTECLLLKDGIGHKLYKSVNELATELRVSDIVTVDVMENNTISRDGKVYTLEGIIVNMIDYGFGSDKGGSVNMFEDFDIDYNQNKYLIETRCSGALMKPFSAIAVESITE